MCIISRHEQVCLMRPFREIPLPSIGLIKHLHDVINLLYYEHWTDKWKYTPYISETRKVLKSCRSKMATWTHDVCDVHGRSFFIMYENLLTKFFLHNTYIWVLLTKQKFAHLSPTWKNSPHQIFIPSLPKVNFFHSHLIKSYNPSYIFSDSHCSCTIFVLIHSFDTHFMQTWILIDVQYSQNAIFSFEKSSNRQNQNYSSSGSHHVVKKFLPAVLTTFWHKVRETL